MAKQTRSKRKPKGLGDVIENITEATGIKKVVSAVLGEDCVDCKERRDKFNRKYPILKNAREFLDEEKKQWIEFEQTKTLFLSKKGSLTMGNIIFVCKLFSDVLDIPYWQPTCFVCKGTANSLKEMIDKLDIIYNTYEK